MSAIKGVVLAAGLGSRLRPLTDSVPKPLLPFCGVPIFYLALARLMRAGIGEIAANAHYLPEQIATAARKNPFAIDIHISWEKEKILGTGGVYGNLGQWRGHAALLAVNGDVVSDFDLRSLTASHAEKKSWATLGLVKGANPAGNSVWVDQTGRVVAISVARPSSRLELTPHIFSGFQVLSNEILEEFAEDTPADLIAVFQNGLSAGKEIYGVYQDCFWHDLGTPRSYFLAHKEFLDRDIASIVRDEHDEFGYGYAVKKMALRVQCFRTSLELDGFQVHGPCVFIGDVTVGGNSAIGPYVIADGGIEIASRSQVRTSILLGKFHSVHKDPLENVIIHNGLVTEF